MRVQGYELLWLFFAYSFLGWLIETVVASGKQRKFVNRGFYSGPVCFIYGGSAALMTVVLQDFQGNLLLRFLACAVLATLVEWCAGKLLERISHKRWWNYSALKWNFDGYICLPYSVLWGILGVLALQYGNEVLLVVYGLIPGILTKLMVWTMGVLAILDFFTSMAAIRYSQRESASGKKFRSRLSAWTYRVGTWVLDHVEGRMEKAYPTMKGTDAPVETSVRFAQGCSITKLFWLFLIGALLGDFTETIFCRLTAGVWMSRSSLVWGPFSIVWGLAIALATALLHRDRNRPDGHIFLIGTVLGGAYEYLCSVFTEIVFGKVFWDYSDIPFNLGGRINLLYCFFWGIAAVVWIKKIYPHISHWIEKIPKRLGVVLTWILAAFMAVNILVSVMALVRYNSRDQGNPANHRWEEVMDQYFDDARMKQIYPNAIAAD